MLSSRDVEAMTKCSPIRFNEAAVNAWILQIILLAAVSSFGPTTVSLF
jgi:hypothetical protein